MALWPQLHAGYLYNKRLTMVVCWDFQRTTSYEMKRLSTALHNTTNCNKKILNLVYTLLLSLNKQMLLWHPKKNSCGVKQIRRNLPWDVMDVFGVAFRVLAVIDLFLTARQYRLHFIGCQLFSRKVPSTPWWPKHQRPISRIIYNWTFYGLSTHDSKLQEATLN